MKNSRVTKSIAACLRERVLNEGERLWSYDDFCGLPFGAVAKSLSRLTREGVLERLSKGVYYRPRQTVFGKSQPSRHDIQKLAKQKKKVFPSGMSAANSLGFTTQNPKEPEVATTALSLPRKLLGDEVSVHTRRPQAWEQLSDTDAALLDFLRRSGKHSELSPEETLKKLLALLSEKKRFERLLKVAATEPPRVRAILGAAGEKLGKKRKVLRQLRETLNPLSKFDFGMFSSFEYAKEWQAKDK